MPEVKNPCIEICQYDDNEICIGCKRTRKEAKSWWRFTEQEKRDVLEKIKTRRAQNTDYYGHYV
jgi:predicted Fe-S protein YdhL (DUF1289 family)